MKNFIYGLVLLTFLSCRKEIIEPKPVVAPIETPDSLSLNGEFVLVSGKLYLDNLEDGSKIVYNHFDTKKSRSSLRYGGAIIPFETIIKDTTTWSFYLPKIVPNVGKFVLNEDTLNPMGLNVTAHNLTVIEYPTATFGSTQLNGSARPIQIDLFDSKQKLIKVYVQEAYLSINGYNYKSFNELIFKKIKEW
jgi:hypothetical protein